jgi:HlyD family secretion protein
MKILFAGSATNFCRMKTSPSPLSFLALLLAMLLAGCSKNSSGYLQGYVEGEYVYVAAPLGGSLTNLAVARGDSVQAGQLLFELESGSEAASIDQAQKNLVAAKTTLGLAEANFQRRQELREGSNGVVSAEELERARADRDASAAQAAAAQAALDKAKWALDQKRQSAPAAGQIHDTLFRVGEYVPAGSPVVSLLPPGNLKIRFFVPQTRLAEIKVGHTVAVNFDGAAKTYSATVNYISTSAEFTPPVIFSRETRANLVFMVEAKFSPADAAELKPGQPVDVEISK